MEVRTAESAGTRALTTVISIAANMVSNAMGGVIENDRSARKVTEP
jgi:hypothetical protein